MKLYTFEFEGLKQSGYAQRIKDKLWLHLNGQTIVLDENENGSKSGSFRKRKKLEGRASADHVSAPMPGKVTKILVKDQDSVDLGQALIVMEAMKMEYTLKSEMVGCVAQVKVVLGQQVSLGEMLIQLEMAK